tara:strand:- start:1021 stop:1146 length:126 start_codon:yes stop_codon:yes gene_type:complete
MSLPAQVQSMLEDKFEEFKEQGLSDTEATKAVKEWMERENE